MSFAIELTGDFDNRRFDTAAAGVDRSPRLRRLDRIGRDPGVATNVAPTALTPGRAAVERWLAAGRWFDFSRSGDLPVDWPIGAASTLGANTRRDRRRHAVQVPCELHAGVQSGDPGAACPHCDDDLVTVAWATEEFGPLQVVDYRYRLRPSKPNQFKLSDGSYHDVSPDIEPICLPGRWARGGTILAIAEGRRAG
ncbi:MAG: hypothetical protein R8G01_17860 [Ilumatobacteraceae bacterium]|nr:hypothetical protein [Ilumatobacteraceae bacterium]